MSKEIVLTQGKVAIVDDDLFEFLNQFKWQYHKERNKRTGYANRTVCVSGKQSTIIMHRVILDAPDDLQVDHVNGIGTDNQRSNLRLATNQQNQRNAFARPGASLYKGVSLCKQAWQAQIGIGGHISYLGHFPTQREAAQAYNDAAAKHFGEFAKLNDLSTILPCDDFPLYDPNRPTSSIYTGISYDKKQSKWQAYATIDGRRFWLGRYETEITAAQIRDAFVKEHRLPYSLNFPDQ